MPEAETPEPVEEPEAPVVEDAPEPPKKPKPRKRATPKVSQIHDMAEKTVAVSVYCDNHPGLEAVLVTDRGGRTSKQAFCVKCAAKLPANYADAR